MLVRRAPASLSQPAGTRGVRASDATDNTDASPATQYTAGSFSQPIRRVFGTVVFRAREELDMPAPGDARAARLHVELRDLLWETLYLPAAALVGFAAEKLNRVQFMTIRGYLTLVFAALVVLLAILAIWQ